MTDIQDRPLVQEHSVTYSRWGPLTGIAFVVLTVASIFIADTPQPDTTGPKVLEYYTKHHDVVIASIAADVVGAVFGLLFLAYVHAWLRRTDRGWLPTVWLLSAGVFTVSALIGGGSEFMLVDQVKHLTPDTARALNAVSTELFEPIGSAAVAAGLIAFAVSTWAQKSAGRGYAVVGVIVAAVSLVLFFTPLGLVAFILWSLAFSIRLLVRKEGVSPLGT